MKRLSQQVNLNKQLESITISELRDAPGSVLVQVELGKTYVITRNGKPVAVLSKVPGAELTRVIQGNGQETYNIPS